MKVSIYRVEDIDGYGPFNSSKEYHRYSIEFEQKIEKQVLNVGGFNMIGTDHCPDFVRAILESNRRYNFAFGVDAISKFKFWFTQRMLNLLNSKKFLCYNV